MKKRVPSRPGLAGTRLEPTKTKMAHVCYDKTRLLLRGFPGRHRHEDPTFTWTYSVFERQLNEAITPSMYHFMAGYVADEISPNHLERIRNGTYVAGDLEAAAVDAYFDEPINERIRMHEQELVNLRDWRRREQDRESAAIDAMLEENRPFDDTSPISQEYSDFMRSIIHKAQDNLQRVNDMIYEEEQWRGGHEQGASDTETIPYDHMEEY